MNRLHCVLGEYIFPEIHSAWERHQKKILDEIHPDRNLDVTIDGQCDSPGHNATYCTVSAMDLYTSKIIQFNIVDVKEVKNSQGMFLRPKEENFAGTKFCGFAVF